MVCWQGVAQQSRRAAQRKFVSQLKKVYSQVVFSSSSYLSSAIDQHVLDCFSSDFSLASTYVVENGQETEYYDGTCDLLETSPQIRFLTEMKGLQLSISEPLVGHFGRAKTGSLVLCLAIWGYRTLKLLITCSHTRRASAPKLIILGTREGQRSVWATVFFCIFDNTRGNHRQAS